MPAAAHPPHADVSPEHGMPAQGDGAQNAGDGAPITGSAVDGAPMHSAANAPVTEVGPGDAQQASTPRQGSSRPVSASTPQPLQSRADATPETRRK
eukprot:1190222-Rhodomonas_salina.1